MRTFVAELLLAIAGHVAGDSLRCRNLRWSVYQYFSRFRDAPDPPPTKFLLRFMEFVPLCEPQPKP